MYGFYKNKMPKPSWQNPIPEDKSYLVDLYLFTGARYLIENDCATVTEFMKLITTECPTSFISNIHTNLNLILLERGMKRVSHIYSLPLKTVRTLYMMNYLGNLDNISEAYKDTTKHMYECIPQKLTAEWKRLVIYLYAKKNFTHAGLSLLTGINRKYFLKLSRKFKAGKFTAIDSMSKTRRTRVMDEAYKKVCGTDNGCMNGLRSEEHYRVN
jgi:hypothetical protein